MRDGLRPTVTIRTGDERYRWRSPKNRIGTDGLTTNSSCRWRSYSRHASSTRYRSVPSSPMTLSFANVFAPTIIWLRVMSLSDYALSETMPQHRLEENDQIIP